MAPLEVLRQSAGQVVERNTDTHRLLYPEQNRTELSSTDTPPEAAGVSSRDATAAVTETKVLTSNPTFLLGESSDKIATVVACPPLITSVLQNATEVFSVASQRPLRKSHLIMPEAYMHLRASDLPIPAHRGKDDDEAGDSKSDNKGNENGNKSGGGNGKDEESSGALGYFVKVAVGDDTKALGSTTGEMVDEGGNRNVNGGLLTSVTCGPEGDSGSGSTSGKIAGGTTGEGDKDGKGGDKNNGNGGNGARNGQGEVNGRGWKGRPSHSPPPCNHPPKSAPCASVTSRPLLNTTNTPAPSAALAGDTLGAATFISTKVMTTTAGGGTVTTGLTRTPSNGLTEVTTLITTNTQTFTTASHVATQVGAASSNVGPPKTVIGGSIGAAIVVLILAIGISRFVLKRRRHQRANMTASLLAHPFTDNNQSNSPASQRVLGERSSPAIQSQPTSHKPRIGDASSVDDNKDLSRDPEPLTELLGNLARSGRLSEVGCGRVDAIQRTIGFAVPVSLRAARAPSVPFATTDRTPPPSYSD